jgi:uncharacterized protein with GYD domain
MALQLVRFGYTAEAWAALLHNPQDRRDMLSARIFGVGGRLEGFWYSNGEHDGYALVDFPDQVAASAVLAAIKATGSFRFLEATPLVTVEEMVEALQKANDFAYVAPGTDSG